MYKIITTMRRFTVMFTVFLFIVIELPSPAQACELDKMGNGCRISNGQCSCGFGCKSEFRYESMEKCKLALTGERHNACMYRSRCFNRGTCLQITSDPGFKCRCEGTGFFGVRCEKPCPGPDNQQHRGSFPHECIVI